jgi:hypothetical protein
LGSNEHFIGLKKSKNFSGVLPWGEGKDGKILPVFGFSGKN